MEVLYFPSHRVLTETNHTTNTNPPFLTAFTVRAEWSLFSSLPLPLCLHLPSLSLLIFPPLALLPVSLRDTRVSLSFAREGGDERQREAREREEACNDLSWWMQLARKCWPNERLEEVMGVTHQSQSSSDHLSVFSGQWKCLTSELSISIKGINWVIMFVLLFCFRCQI